MLTGTLDVCRSNKVTTKFFVPAGAPLQCRGGDKFPPVQPNALAV
jgi:hypothetical protein